MNDDRARTAVEAPVPIAPTAPGNALQRRLAAIATRTGVPFRIVFANGAIVGNLDVEPAFTIRLKTRRAERRTVLFGYIGMLEAYFDGDIDIDGDLALMFRAGFDSGYDLVPNRLAQLRNHLHERRHTNRSLANAKANARFHYGHGIEFYRPWLDTVGMMYTCGYWKEGTTTLEQAQRNKMDHVCRKVQLAPGETFIDVGSGWGGLLFHAWDNYGAVGTGINTTT
jgi:cyclopropane-fatty-acyl-phospholipid synthase